MKILDYAKRIGGEEAIMRVKGLIENEFRSCDFLRRLSITFDRNYGKFFFATIPDEVLVRLLNSPPVDCYLMEALYTMSLAPLPETVHFAQCAGKKAVYDLEAMIINIGSGNFDPNSRLHLELEYSRYRSSAEFSRFRDEGTLSFGAADFCYFSKLPWVEGTDVNLGQGERDYINITAAEAADVFRVINEKKASSTNPLLVIANMRYGSYFVVGPMEGLISDLGAYVVHEYVSSFDLDKYPEFRAYLSSGTLDFIEKNRPDVLVVDGTTCPGNVSLSRFPSAMLAYIREFKEAGYSISFWHPMLTDLIMVGKTMMGKDDFKGGDRELTVVCANSIGGSYSGALFDDPEKYCIRACLGFTRNGLSVAPVSMDVDSFVKAVQREMMPLIIEDIQKAAATSALSA
ncbi:hypothetical protein HYU11_04385 [Candidatus Woesearchaeota archaeon]|nr:hypothetical protein [Candidatus Woesearchaeota archaeon]